MSTGNIAAGIIAELQSEVPSTRKCLERIPESTFDFKPHPKSMEMRYLLVLVAGIPGWIKYMIEDGEIDLANSPTGGPSSTADMVKLLDDSVAGAVKALEGATDADFEEIFTLKRNGEVLYTSPKKIDIPTTINHWVHHRGQLTVYMRLNDILVPSIYGPSADDKSFAGH